MKLVALGEVTSREGISTPLLLKVAPSLRFLNKNALIFCCNSFKIVSGGRGSNFVAVHGQNVDQIAYLFLYVMLLEKAVLLKKKSQNGRWPQLFSPKMCSVKPVLPEELKKKSGCFCSKYLISLLRHVYVKRLVWTSFLCTKRFRSPYTCIRRPSPFWHDCLLRCALRLSHLKNMTVRQKYWQKSWSYLITWTSFLPIFVRGTHGKQDKMQREQHKT